MYLIMIKEQFSAFFFNISCLFFTFLFINIFACCSLYIALVLFLYLFILLLLSSSVICLCTVQQTYYFNVLFCIFICLEFKYHSCISCIKCRETILLCTYSLYIGSIKDKLKKKGNKYIRNVGRTHTSKNAYHVRQKKKEKKLMYSSKRKKRNQNDIELK